MKYDKENDVERILRDDSRQKKRDGIGVYKRASRRGYIRGGVRTQSDFLTAKQRRNLSSEVRVYNMYEEYKNIENCDLNEILSKNDTEIKAILTIIKSNNSCKQICDQFNVSNGKLYTIYDKYEVEYGKRPVKPKDNKDKLNNIAIMNVKDFKKLQTIEKGNYINEIKVEHNISIVELSKHWGISKNTLNHYFSKRNQSAIAAADNEQLEIEQVTNKIETDVIEDKEEIKEVQEVIEINNEDKLNKRIEDLENHTKDLEAEKNKLVEHILEISKKNSEEKVINGLNINLNGEYSKDELSTRLLSLDSITIEGARYRIKLHLEEI